MRVEIIGLGSLGLLFAAKLKQSTTAHIKLWTRTEKQAEQIRIDGIQLQDMNHTQSTIVFSNEEVESMECRSELNSLPKIDWLWLTVKQSHIDDKLIRFVQHRLSLGGNLLCFQNGIGHTNQFLRVLSDNQVFVAVTTEAALKSSQTQIAHTGQGVTIIGSFNEVTSSEFYNKTDSVVQLLQGAGFNSYMSKDTRVVVWNKLIMNAVINPLTAIMRIRNGQLLESPIVLELMRSLYIEAVEVARSVQVYPAESLWDSLLEVCRNTANNQSSMLQDILSNQQTEIEAINGSIIRLGKEKCVETPSHEIIYRIIKGLESTYEKAGE